MIQLIYREVGAREGTGNLLIIQVIQNQWISLIVP
jgi:hypothetical protein